MLHLESDIEEAHQRIESLTEATRKFSAIIEHRLGEKISPPFYTESQEKLCQRKDAKRDALFLESDKRSNTIRILEQKLQEVKADLIKEEQTVRQNNKIINVNEPVEEFVREVFRDANSSRRPKRKRYTPQCCMKKEE